MELNDETVVQPVRKRGRKPAEKRRPRKLRPTRRSPSPSDFEDSEDEIPDADIKDEPYSFSSEDELPLAGTVADINVKQEKEDDVAALLRLRKQKRRKNIDLDALRESLKQFGDDMESKLEEMIIESQKNTIQKVGGKITREKIECPLCGERFFEILSHLDRHANKPSFNCSLCNKSFTFKGKLMDHKKFVHGINYTCEICNKRFNNRDNIRIHMATHETEEKFVCYICGYLTKRRQCLAVHMMRHEDKWVCHCKVCNRGFFSYATLEQHMNAHTGEKPYTCDQCGVNYSNYNTLWKHSRKFHPELYHNLFSCKICGKVFMKEKSYQIHMANLHSKGNHFECNSCTKTFKKELSLLIHQRTHTNERPFCCKICGGAFTARKYLTKHMGVHKTKNYKCRFCYKKFMQEQALMNHERKHEEVR